MNSAKISLWFIFVDRTIRQVSRRQIFQETVNSEKINPPEN